MKTISNILLLLIWLVAFVAADTTVEIPETPEDEEPERPDLEVTDETETTDSGEINTENFYQNLNQGEDEDEEDSPATPPASTEAVGSWLLMAAKGNDDTIYDYSTFEFFEGGDTEYIFTITANEDQDSDSGSESLHLAALIKNSIGTNIQVTAVGDDSTPNLVYDIIMDAEVTNATKDAGSEEDEQQRLEYFLSNALPQMSVMEVDNNMLKLSSVDGDFQIICEGQVADE